MRHSAISGNQSPYRIIAVDDENGIIDSLSVFLKRSGYQLTGCTDPLQAIKMVKEDHYDLMLLDFIMTPIHGDKVVEEIRKFNQEIYIILLTGLSIKFYDIWICIFTIRNFIHYYNFKYASNI